MLFWDMARKCGIRKSRRYKCTLCITTDARDVCALMQSASGDRSANSPLNKHFINIAKVHIKQVTNYEVKAIPVWTSAMVFGSSQ
jgi:hypothetical protein